MGDRGHNRQGPKREGCCIPLAGGGASWVPIQHNVAWAEVYFRTKWHLDPSSHLATIDMGPNWVGAVPFWLGELGPHRTQSHLGRGLPPYQVAS